MFKSLSEPEFSELENFQNILEKRPYPIPQTLYPLILGIMVLLSCTDAERDNPYDPVNYRDGNGNVGSSSSSVEAGGSSSSSGKVSPSLSSSSADVSGSSSSSTEHDGSSSSVAGSGSSSSNFAEISSSSEEQGSSSSVGLCGDFVNGTKREHYGMEKEQFCDERDGKKYVYMKIGDQTWMAENLNYEASGSKCGNGSTLSDANTTTCDTYGRLYNWNTAMGGAASSIANPSGVQGVCPSGWHFPSNAEWNVLMKFVSPSCSDNATCAGAGTKLKSASRWNASGTGSYIPGTDNYGFSALPGGQGFPDNNFNFVGNNGWWWSVSEYNINNAYYRRMGSGVNEAYWSNINKNQLLSVRCVRD